MKIVLTYFVAVFINPILIILISIMLFPKALQESILGILIQTTIAGFASIWLGKTIFNIFELQPDPLMIFLIGSVFLGLILLYAIFRRGNPSVVALVRAGTVACPYSGRR